MTRLVVFFAAALLGTTAMAAPKIAPVPESAWTDEQRELTATFGKDGITNEFRTFLSHPQFIRGVFPFENYIFTDTALTPRDRELLVLRTAWHTNSNFYWAKHVPRALAAGLSAAEIARIAKPGLAGWDKFEATLLHAADEVHENAYIDTPTWQALGGKYDQNQMMDATFTISETIMMATMVDSIGVEPDASLTARLPNKAPHVASAKRQHEVLATPRIHALDASEWTPEVRAMLDPSGSGRYVIGIYRTFAQNQRLYPPRQLQSGYINSKVTITQRQKETAILRSGWMGGAEYEWSAHAGSGRKAGLSDAEIVQLATPGYAGWSPHDAAIVRAVDEMYADDKVSDGTWKALATEFNPGQILDLMVAGSGYRIVSEVLNTFGVKYEANHESFPSISKR
jgi:4-carboxymuconolactone decarboxylase